MCILTWECDVKQGGYSRLGGWFIDIHNLSSVYFLRGAWFTSPDKPLCDYVKSVTNMFNNFRLISFFLLMTSGTIPPRMIQPPFIIVLCSLNLSSHMAFMDETLNIFLQLVTHVCMMSLNYVVLAPFVGFPLYYFPFGRRRF